MADAARPHRRERGARRGANTGSPPAAGQIPGQAGESLGTSPTEVKADGLGNQR